MIRNMVGYVVMTVVLDDCGHVLIVQEAKALGILLLGVLSLESLFLSVVK